MKITFIEPTPSPNTMKLHLDESLEAGIRRTYTPESRRSAPSWAQDMLEIPGVTSIYHAADFAALERKGSADWAAILREVQSRFGSGDGVADDWSLDRRERRSPLSGKPRCSCPDVPRRSRFRSASRPARRRSASACRAASREAVTDVASAVLIKERKLTDYGVRYGEPAGHCARGGAGAGSGVPAGTPGLSRAAGDRARNRRRVRRAAAQDKEQGRAAARPAGRGLARPLRRAGSTGTDAEQLLPELARGAARPQAAYPQAWRSCT
jgi:hypothetical protein